MDGLIYTSLCYINAATVSILLNTPPLFDTELAGVVVVIVLLTVHEPADSAAFSVRFKVH